MVRGLDTFREYFRDFKDCFVLIGGAASHPQCAQDKFWERTASGQFTRRREKLFPDNLTGEFAVISIYFND